MTRKQFYIGFIIFFVLYSCGSDSSQKLNVDVSHIKIPDFKIERYGQALFNIDTLNFLEELVNVQHKYEVFLGAEKLTKTNTQSLYKYITDPKLIQLNKKVQQNYPDLFFLENELKNAFQYYRYYFPKAILPNVYTYVSGFNFERPIQLSEKALIIGLDLYLGEDFETYKKYGIPVYKSARMTNEHIAVDCMKEMARIHLYENKVSRNFLDEIIENAKSLYFLDAMLPEKEDHLKIGFTKSQIEWCKQNEQNIWAFFIDQQILYSSDYEITRKFIHDGPFTLIFSKEAPAGIGNWIGWQIIRSYMKNNPDVTLPELIKTLNAQNILKNSRYKPKQK